MQYDKDGCVKIVEKLLTIAVNAFTPPAEVPITTISLFATATSLSDQKPYFMEPPMSAQCERSGRGSQSLTDDTSPTNCGSSITPEIFRLSDALTLLCQAWYRKP